MSRIASELSIPVSTYRHCTSGFSQLNSLCARIILLRSPSEERTEIGVRDRGPAPHSSPNSMVDCYHRDFALDAGSTPETRCRIARPRKNQPLSPRTASDLDARARAWRCRCSADTRSAALPRNVTRSTTPLPRFNPLRRGSPLKQSRRFSGRKKSSDGHSRLPFDAALRDELRQSASRSTNFSPTAGCRCVRRARERSSTCPRKSAVTLCAGRR